MRFLICLALMASSVAAQGKRSGDTELDLAALDAALSGHVIEFFDGSKSYYYGDGTYNYTYVDGGEEWSGTYSLAAHGKVCVQLDVSGSRCDTYVLSGNRLVLIIKDGTRFPVRSQSALD